MNLHVESHGTGPDVVLLHGWGLNSACWGQFAKHLAQTCRVHAVDLPGHGGSDWRTAQAGLDVFALAVRDCVPPGATLLGWSLGSLVALQLALIAGAEVSRLVLVAATPRFTSGPDWVDGMPSDQLDHFAARLAMDYPSTLREFLTLQVRGEERPHAVLRELKARLAAGGTPQPAALAAGLALLSTVDLRADLHRIRHPVLVIGGGYDRLTPPAAARFLAQSLPNAMYVEVRRAGHAPFLSHGPDVVQAVRAFLEADPGGLPPATELR